MANTFTKFMVTTALAASLGFAGSIAHDEFGDDLVPASIEERVEAPQEYVRIEGPERFVGHPDEIKGWTARYFKPHEFASKGNGLLDLDARMVDALDATRHAFGKPIRITSGYRDPEHNKRVGGAKNSQHLHGLAVDIDLTDYSTEERYRLMVLLMQHGFTSFGSYDRSPNMLHADMRERAAKWNHGDGVHPAWFQKALSDAGWAKGDGPTKPVALASAKPGDAGEEIAPEGSFSLGIEADQETARINARLTEDGFEGTASVEIEEGREPKLEVGLSHQLDERWSLTGEGSYDAETKDAAFGLNLEYRF